MTGPLVPVGILNPIRASLGIPPDSTFPGNALVASHLRAAIRSSDVFASICAIALQTVPGISNGLDSILSTRAADFDFDGVVCALISLVGAQGLEAWTR
jgi:hypothetical protein